MGESEETYLTAPLKKKKHPPLREFFNAQSELMFGQSQCNTAESAVARIS